ncbi:MAG: translation elongation factor Ts [Spirochaetia bacterium]|jgi:elongation factor Ts|nr:translation elongation factor Ts [Spirochaetia bacterium]
MAKITASLVKELRDSTGAGMMDCKKALVQADGDFEAANKILMEMGLAAVAKRADRATENGSIFTKITATKAVIVELTCETDFVAQNTDFQKLGNDICTEILEKGYTEINDALTEMVNGLIATIKENMLLRKFEVIDLAENGYASTYIHDGGKKGVLVEFSADKKEAFEDASIKEFCHDCALHVAAYTPTFLKPEEIPAEKVEELTGIFTKQAEGMGKPAKIIPNIVKGMLKKHYDQICFLNQTFIKDDKCSVAAKAREIGKAAGYDLQIVGYQLYTTGE